MCIIVTNKFDPETRLQTNLSGLFLGHSIQSSMGYRTITMTIQIQSLPTGISDRIAKLLAAGHFTNDFFTGSLGIILAASQLDLSNSQIGLAGSVMQGISIMQPGLGWLADRIERTYLMLIGALITAIGVGVCAYANSFTVIFMACIFAGVGNAMFHPIALATSRAFARKKSSGRAVALFMAGGNTGFAVGPLVLGVILDTIGLDGVGAFVIIAGLVMPSIVWQLAPYVRGRLPEAKTTARHDTAQHYANAITGKIPWWRTTKAMLIAYLFVVFLRGTVHTSLGIYMPRFYKESNHSLIFAGVATSILLFSAAAGSYLGAALSDFLPRRRILLISFVGIAPILYIMLHAQNELIIGLSSIALGLLVNSNWPILLMIGQEVLPGKAVTASAFAFGWGFFSSAVATSAVGFVADSIGLQDALSLLGIMPLVGVLFLYLLPSDQHAPTSAEVYSQIEKEPAHIASD